MKTATEKAQALVELARSSDVWVSPDGVLTAQTDWHHPYPHLKHYSEYRWSIDPSHHEDIIKCRSEFEVMMRLVELLQS